MLVRCQNGAPAVLDPGVIVMGGEGAGPAGVGLLEDPLVAATTPPAAAAPRTDKITTVLWDFFAVPGTTMLYCVIAVWAVVPWKAAFTRISSFPLTLLGFRLLTPAFPCASVRI